MKIAVDLLGGDFAPKKVIAGIRLAIDRGFIKSEELVAIGDEEAFKSFAWRWLVRRHPIETILGAKLDPQNLRNKASSIAIGVAQVKAGVFNAFMSAGNTAVVTMMAVALLGRIKERVKPAIGVPLPDSPNCLLLDIGAIVDCTVDDFFNLALMGSTYANLFWGVRDPLVALLNIGVESHKGPPVLVETHKQFTLGRHRPDGLPFTFGGNVEADKIFSPGLQANVVVCDGFVGNMVLKEYEVLKKRSNQANWQDIGALPLLGVNGNVLIAHGKSKAKAIANAIKAAKTAAIVNVNQQLAKLLAEPAPALSSV